jgi:hypothetical protein
MIMWMAFCLALGALLCAGAMALRRVDHHRMTAFR